ncbi:MAG: hypothetical protein KDB88_05790 [Flavobacteriales bacterium]|nr:hypothetical protein [Flavobacteriales bacterium]
MKNKSKRYEQLKRQAKRLMLAGDVSTYMSKLRELYQLSPGAGALPV